MNFVKTSLLLGSTAAWKFSGHVTVARIAYDILEKKKPEVIKQVEAILKPLQDDFPDWTVKEGSHPFVECATYADDIKMKGGSFQSAWHFTDVPYLDDGGSLADYDF